MFDVPGMHVTEVHVDDQQRLVLTVESDQLQHGCPGCGVLAVGHGRRCRVLQHKAGVQTAEVSALLGHATAGFTMSVYTHSQTDERRRSVESYTATLAGRGV